MMRTRNQRVVKQLLDEFEAGRFDSPLVQRIFLAAGAFPRLLRACFLAQRGQYAAARNDVDEALPGVQDNPVLALVAGLVLHVTRDYQRALDLFEQAARSKSAAHRARQMGIALAGGLGWEHDVRRLIEQAIAEEPGHAVWHAHAVRFFVRGRHWPQALEHARRALELAPDNPSLWMETAGLHARLDHRAQAVDAIARALDQIAGQGDPSDGDAELPYRLEAARVAIDASDFELAVACLERALEIDPRQPAVHVRLAEIHSWKDEDEAAGVHARAALELDPDHGPALRMLGALAVRAQRYDEALDLLQQALARDGEDYQIYVWQAEAHLRCRRFEEAQTQLHQGTMKANGFLFVAWLLRFLIVAYLESPTERISVNRTEEFDAAIRELAPGLADRALDSRMPDDLVAAVEAALTALRGNRSIYATHVVDGVLTRLHTRTGCRFESRRILQLLRVATGDECLALFDQLIPRYPGSSLPICHRGELHLWLGNFDEARADLERALELVEGTRWAYMGLSTLHLLAGEPKACLRINAEGVAVMRNTEGPAIYVYRGEAKRMLGLHDEAITELEESVRWHPARASATINLALAYHAKGDSEAMRPLWRRLIDEQAGGLLSDAAHELGLVIVGDLDWEPEDTVKAQVLEKALKMMGANRSSGLITYWTGDGKLRFVQLWPYGGPKPHARDHDHLERGKRMLLAALNHYQGPTSPQGPPQGG